VFCWLGQELVERVYLDTNVYCRPLDDQGNRRIRRESIAFLEIVDRTLRGEVQVISSDYVKFEIEKILDPLKRKDVRSFERTLATVNVSSSNRLRRIAKEVVTQCDINALDALHVSAACISEAKFFITCDDNITGRRGCIERLVAEKGYKLKVRNPIEYLRERWRIDV